MGHENRAFWKLEEFLESRFFLNHGDACDLFLKQIIWMELTSLDIRKKGDAWYSTCQILKLEKLWRRLVLILIILK
jgi:hypothetical protein